MFGPLFLLEWKYAARRCRHFESRSAFGAAFVLIFLLFLGGWVWRSLSAGTANGPAWRIGVQLAGDQLPLFAGVHWLSILLVTPALAAASITDEKSRGTLALLMTTELSVVEIVLGKWLGQVAQVLVLTLPAVPFIVYLQGMCGLAPTTVCAWAVGAALLAQTLAAVSLLVSVWARKTVNAVLIVYLIVVAALAAAGIAGCGDTVADLSLVFPAYDGLDIAWPTAMGAMAGLTAMSLAVAGWRLRAACAAETARRTDTRWRRWFDRPPVSAAPLRWKERYLGELGLLRFVWKLPRWAALVLALGLGLLAFWLMPDSDDAFTLHGIAMICVVCLLVALRSSAVIAREREQATWEPILITPLEPRELVRGKLWGILDSVKGYMLAYLVGTLVWAVPNGWWPAFITGYCWFAAWGFLYFHAANGVYWSARSPNSLKAMLYTFATGWTSILWSSSFVVLLFAGAVAACVVGGLGARVTSASVVGIILVLGNLPLCLYGFAAAEQRLQLAEKHIAETDRVVQGRGRSERATYPHRTADLIRR